MDVLLVSASATLAYSLPTTEGLTARSFPVKSVLLLSFLLFSLSILDATPSGWLLLLDGSIQTTAYIDGTNIQKQQSAGYRSIEFAYSALLWSMAVVILIINPTILGTIICTPIVSWATSLRSHKPRDADDQKAQNSFAASKSRRYPPPVRILLLIVRLLFRVITTILWLAFGWIWTCLLKSFPSKPKETILPMIGNDAGRPSAAKCFARFVCLGSDRITTIVLGCLLGTTSAYLLLRRIALVAVGPDWGHQTLLAKAVSLMFALGIVISSVLNGFGSVSMPHSCLVGMFLTPIRPEAIANAETELDKTLQILKDRRESMEGLKLDVNKLADPTSRRKATGNFGDLGDEVSQRRKLVSEDIAFLETLVEEMKQDLIDMRHSQYEAVISRTSVGRLRSGLGVVFSLILIIRLVSAVWQILSWSDNGSGRGQPRVDAITKALLMSRMSAGDAELLSQFISLILTAFLSFSQVRYFLKTVTTIHWKLTELYSKLCCRREWNITPSYHPMEVVAPVLAGLMGCYFLAAVVLTKLMLPLKYRAGYSAALGEAHSAVHIRLESLNAIFVASALVSGLILGMRVGIQRQNTQRYLSWIAKDIRELDP